MNRLIIEHIARPSYPMERWKLEHFEPVHQLSAQEYDEIVYSLDKGASYE